MATSNLRTLVLDPDQVGCGIVTDTVIGPTASNRLAISVPTTTSTPSRPTVLVVDDDSAVRLSLGFLLETTSFAVRLFASGRELLASSQFPETGCILVDRRTCRV